jgi:hypothetical protein
MARCAVRPARPAAAAAAGLTYSKDVALIQRQLHELSSPGEIAPMSRS